MVNSAQIDSALDRGSELARQGRLNEAAEVLRDACARAPEQPRLFLHLGRILSSLEDHDGATRCFERVVALTRKDLIDQASPARQPDVFLEAARQLAARYRMSGRPLHALNYLYDCVFLSDDPEIRRQFTDCVSSIPFAEAQPSLKPLLVRALSETWGEPAPLIRFSATQLLLEPQFGDAARRVATASHVVALDDPAVRIITTDKLLRASLSAGIVAHPVLEKALTAVRRVLLDVCITSTIASPAADTQLASFAVALANQCFVTEYAYAMTPDEAAKVARLQEELSRAAVGSMPIAALTLAVVASYRPLYRLDCAAALQALSWPATVEPVILTQLRAPGKEHALRAAISRLTPIADEVSTRVRAQYEENPFPRWVTTPIGTRRLFLGQWLRGMFPHLPPALPRYQSPATALDILVAGCGSGQEAVKAATCFANSRVLAIDLSLASLAHAVRKTGELGIGNITYAQADILALGELDRQFDIVECVGVLHHLRDPLAGWRVLSRLTKPGGYMLLGLYSELGRRDLDPARALIARCGYGSEPDDLRRFRTDVLALAEDDPVRGIALLRDDFYNLSMLRDLLFHVQETRFTIPTLRAALAEVGLDFGGFVVAPEISSGYLERFGQAADPTSLEQWEAFERERPDTFSGMYQFLALKRTG